MGPEGEGDVVELGNDFVALGEVATPYLLFDLVIVGEL